MNKDMNSELSDKESRIKDFAYSLGFDACGIAVADETSEDIPFLKQWLDNGYAAGMGYMHNHFEKRTNPRLLVEGSRSIIVVALNYYPNEKQPDQAPQFAYYAYGKDYHDVVKSKLRELYKFINDHISPVSGRMFTDSAPVLERYWAVKAGLGFIGKNSQLILPGKGSYFFLGELIIDLELMPDVPLVNGGCGSCRRCMEACPTKAIVAPRTLDANRCLSYLTIEHKGEFTDISGIEFDNHIYGCDICQQVCPWNRFATPNLTPEFQPSPDFLSIDKETIDQLDQEHFSLLFRVSAVRRAGLAGLKRNLKACGL